MGEGDPERRKDGHDRSGRRGRLLDEPPLVASHRPHRGRRLDRQRALDPRHDRRRAGARARASTAPCCSRSPPSTPSSIFLDITFEEATNFYGNRALHDGDIAGLRALLRLSLKVDIAIGVVVTALVVALSGVLADLASAGRLDPTLVQISALSVLVTTADSTAFAALALAQRVDLRARALAATSAFRLIGVIIAVQLGGAEAVAISYVLGGAAGSLVLGEVRMARGLAPVGARVRLASRRTARSAPGAGPLRLPFEPDDAACSRYRGPWCR